MEFRLGPLGFIECFQNNNHQAVKKGKIYIYNIIQYI